MTAASLTHAALSLTLEAGACAAGIARCEPTADADADLYTHWISRGDNGELDYMLRYGEQRRDPASLLPGARSIIMAAFRYSSPRELPTREPGDPRLNWARYSVGDDYHEVLRRRLGEVARRLHQEAGDIPAQGDGDTPQWRVTVDTAPMRERYWAWRAGLGVFGLNGQLIVPQAGSWVLLGGILTTLELTPSRPLTSDLRAACLKCGRCVASCPGHALDGRGGVDSRRCMSCLTIESRACVLPDEAMEHIRRTGRVYGCDICQEVCPMNASALRGEVIAELQPREELLRLTRHSIEEMEQPEFSRLMSHSAIKRAKLAGLKRNCR